ncbi:MAG: PAS domain S-box protein, partial [Burkholderiaceae bacterium]
HAVAEGQLDARVELDPDATRSELAQLGRAFNRMAESLQARQSELDAALRRTEREHALLDLVINSMSEGVIAADAQGRFLLFNAAARAVFPAEATGTTLDVWRQRHDLFMAHGQTPDALDRPLARAIRGERVDKLDVLVRTAQGERRTMRMNIRPLRDAQQQRLGGLVVFADITERQQAEADLAHSHRALRMLSRCNAALVRAEDEQQLLLEVCRLAVDVGGYRMAWVGYAQDDEFRTILPMAHAGAEKGYLSAIRLSWSADDPTGRGPAGRTVRSGEPTVCADITTEETFFHSQEEAMQRGYRSMMGLPLRDTERTFGLLALYSAEVHQAGADEVRLLQELADNLAFGIGNLRTRQERQRIAEAVRIADARVREQASLLDKAQDAITVRDLAHRVSYWNHGAERLYGWSAAEASGQSVQALMYRDVSPFRQAMGELMARGEWVGELEQVAKDGTPLVIEGRWTRVDDEQGRPTGVLAINTDIRERKRAQQEIIRLNASLEERVRQRTAQLEAANKELEAFSYSVSHDLRSPLSAIDGFSQVLEQDLGEALDPRGRHYLNRIRAGVAQMGVLIDDLLSLAQLSRASMKWEAMDLSAMALKVLEDLQEREPTREVQLQVQPGLQAHGDPRLMMRVIENLLGNAWKFSAGRSRAEITVGRDGGADGEAVFFVRDNGAGFDMSYAHKLFGTFQRLHTVAEFPGTGIGLATVHRIVSRHGGRVWAQAAPEQGATFFFTLGSAAP